MNPSYGNQVSESRRGRDEAPRPSPSSISARRALTVREQLDRVMATLRHSLRFWKAGAALFLLGLVITAPVAMTRPRVYRSEALLLYKERINPLDRDAGSNTGLRIGMRLRELVLSRSNLERIITEMNLYEKLVDEQGMNPAVDFLRTKINFKAREGATCSTVSKTACIAGLLPILRNPLIGCLPAIPSVHCPHRLILNHPGWSHCHEKSWMSPLSPAVEHCLWNTVGSSR